MDPIALTSIDAFKDSLVLLDEVNDYDGKQHMQINFDKLLSSVATKYVNTASKQKPLWFWKYDSQSKQTLNNTFNLGFQGFSLSGFKSIIATETTTAGTDVKKISFEDQIDINQPQPVPIFDINGRVLLYQYNDAVYAAGYTQLTVPQINNPAGTPLVPGWKAQATGTAAGLVTTATTTPAASKICSVALTGSRETKFFTYSASIMSEFTSIIQSRVPKFVTVKTSSNDIANAGLKYSEMIPLFDPWFVNKDLTCFVAMSYIAKDTTVFNDTVMKIDTDVTMQGAMQKDLVKYSTELMQIFAVFVGIMLRNIVPFNIAVFTAQHVGPLPIGEIRSFDEKGQPILSQFSTQQELESYLALQGLKTPEDLNRKILQYFLNELQKTIDQANEEAAKYAQDTQYKFLNGAALSNYTDLPASLTTKEISQTTLWLGTDVGAQTDLDQFYIPTTSQKKNLTLVQLDQTITDATIEQEFLVCVDNLSLGTIKRSKAHLLEKCSNSYQDFFQEDCKAYQGSAINVQIKDTVDGAENKTLKEYYDFLAANTTSTLPRTYQQSSLYKLSTFCEQGFFSTVLDIYSSKTNYSDVIIADSQIKHSTQYLKLQQQSLEDLRSLKLYANILRIQSADMQHFEQRNAGDCQGRKLGQYQIATIALSKDKNTDWRLGTIVNVILYDGKVITYLQTNVVNNFLTASTYAGTMTGQQLQKQLEYSISSQKISKQNVAIRQTLSQIIKLDPFVQDNVAQYRLNFSEDTCSQQVTFTDTDETFASKKPFTYELANQGLQQVQKELLIDSSTKAKAKLKVPNFAIVSQISDGEKRYYLLNTSDDICFNSVTKGSDGQVLQAQITTSKNCVLQQLLNSTPENATNDQLSTFYYNPNQVLQTKDDKISFDVYFVIGSNVVQRQVTIPKDRENNQKVFVYEILQQLDCTYDEKEQIQDPYTYRKHLEDNNTPYVVIDDYLNIDRGQLLEKLDDTQVQQLDRTMIGNMFNVTNQIFGQGAVLTPGSTGKFATNSFVRLGYKYINRKLEGQDDQCVEFTSRYNPTNGFYYKTFINSNHTYLFTDDTRKDANGNIVRFSYQPIPSNSGLTMSQNNGYSQNSNVILKDNNSFLYVHELPYCKQEDDKTLDQLYDDKNFGRPIQVQFSQDGDCKQDNLALEFQNLYQLLLYFTNLQVHMINVNYLDNRKKPGGFTSTCSTIWEIKVKLNFKKYYQTSDDILWANGLTGEIEINDLGNKFENTFFADVNNNVIEKLATYDYEFIIQAKNIGANNIGKEMKRIQNLVITQDQVSEYCKDDEQQSFILSYDSRYNQILDQYNNKVKLQKGYPVNVSFFNNDPIFGRYIKDLQLDNADQLFNAIYLLQDLFRKGKITQISPSSSQQISVQRQPYVLFPQNQPIPQKYKDRLKLVQHQRQELEDKTQVFKLLKGSCLTILDSQNNRQLGLIGKLRISYDKSNCLAVKSSCGYPSSFQKILQDKGIITCPAGKDGLYFINQDVVIDDNINYTRMTLEGIQPENKKNNNSIQVRVNNSDLCAGQTGYIQPYTLKDRLENSCCKLQNFKFVTIGNQSIDLKNNFVIVDVCVSYADITFSQQSNGSLVYFADSRTLENVQQFAPNYSIIIGKDVITQGQNNLIKSYSYTKDLVAETKYYLTDNCDSDSLVKDILQDLSVGQRQEKPVERQRSLSRESSCEDDKFLNKIRQAEIRENILPKEQPDIRKNKEKWRQTIRERRN